VPRLASSLPEEVKVGHLVGEMEKGGGREEAAGGEGSEAGEEGRDEELHSLDIPRVYREGAKRTYKSKVEVEGPQGHAPSAGKVCGRGSMILPIIKVGHWKNVDSCIIDHQFHSCRRAGLPGHL
jgi:hypothetical protein